MKRLLFILLFLLLVAGLFYWFQWRPSEIRKECNQIAWENAKYLDDRSNALYKDPNPQTRIDTDKYDWNYNQCLHSQGLK